MNTDPYGDYLEYGMSPYLFTSWVSKDATKSANYAGQYHSKEEGKLTIHPIATLSNMVF